MERGILTRDAVDGPDRSKYAHSSYCRQVEVVRADCILHGACIHVHTAHSHQIHTGMIVLLLLYNNNNNRKKILIEYVNESLFTVSVIWSICQCQCQ